MQITRNDDFGGALLNCAVRYALGRASYMPRLVMDQIRPILPDCSDNTLVVFEQDVSEWMERSKPKSGFFDNYYDYWAWFLDDVRAEIEKRKSECK